MKSKLDTLTVPYRLRIEPEVEKMIEMICVRDNDTTSDVMRRALRRGIELELADQFQDPLLYAIQKAVRTAIQPTEDRLAKISAKTGIAAATAMYTNLQVYADLGKNADVLHERAKAQGAKFISQPVQLESPN